MVIIEVLFVLYLIIHAIIRRSHFRDRLPQLYYYLMMAIIIISSIFFSTSVSSGMYEMCFAHAIFMLLSVVLTQGIHTAILYTYNIVHFYLFLYLFYYRNMQKWVYYLLDPLLFLLESGCYISLYNVVSLEYGMILAKLYIKI